MPTTSESCSINRIELNVRGITKAKAFYSKDADEHQLARWSRT